MEVNDTMILTVIHKEKKEKDYRMIIVPSGKSKIGIGQMKDYGIISYLGKGEEEKIGELILWALEQSDNKKIINYKDIRKNLGGRKDKDLKDIFIYKE